MFNPTLLGIEEKSLPRLIRDSVNLTPFDDFTFPVDDSTSLFSWLPNEVLAEVAHYVSSIPFPRLLSLSLTHCCDLLVPEVVTEGSLWQHYFGR